MSTKTVNQHYLPQLLLRGFLGESSGKSGHLWVYRKESEPFRTSPRNIGAERFFYADPEENSLERDLSVRESVFAETVISIRTNGEIDQAALPVVQELIGQMVARTKNVRTGLATTGEVALRHGMEEMFESPERLVKSTTEVVQQKLSQEGIHLPAEHLRRLVGQATPLFFEHFERMGGVERAIREIDVPKAAKLGQVRALERSREEMGKRFRDLTWRVKRVREGDFILGDVGPIALGIRNKRGRPGIFFSPEHEHIVLPISDSLAIIAGKGDFSAEDISMQRINTTSAKLSVEFFVSSTNRPRDLSLHQVIGLDRRYWRRNPLKGSQRRPAGSRKRRGG